MVIMVMAMIVMVMLVMVSQMMVRKESILFYYPQHLLCASLYHCKLYDQNGCYLDCHCDCDHDFRHNNR